MPKHWELWVWGGIALILLGAALLSLTLLWGVVLMAAGMFCVGHGVRPRP